VAWLAAAYLSLGSNMGDREANVRKALDLLADRMTLMKVSSLYETAPIGVTDQNDFINAVALVETELHPTDLLDAILDIERIVGRVRNLRWGPRVIDIDILLYDDEAINTPELIIPHPEIMNRAFVLIPLGEIAPDLELPEGLKPSQAIGKLEDQRVRKLAEVA
jgi:2-amino-4-hydroxy-6-hydroxymethyldihydropteridine diphosphokinase